ncbi:TlpA family protein disulfide reductase [Candidatus Woesearchaeota archaeon]|nr:TlpA family protein disulfide reductase [Candidatus Woesearchaeota archaeon]
MVTFMRKNPFSLHLLLLIVAISAAFLISGCTGGSSRSQSSLTGAATLEDLEGREVPAAGDHTPLVQAAPTAPVGNTKGFTAPDFTIKTIDGKAVSLQQLTSEKPTLLYFWATWCPYCKRDLAAASKVYPEYKDKVNFLAIDLDPKESVAAIAAYKRNGGHDFIDFAPADLKVLQGYGITSTTTKFAIDRSRLILWRGSGEVDEKTWRIILDGLANS